MTISVYEVSLRHSSGVKCRAIISRVSTIEEAKAKALRSLRDRIPAGVSAAWDVLKPLAVVDAEWVVLAGQQIQTYESEEFVIVD